MVTTKKEIAARLRLCADAMIADYKDSAMAECLQDLARDVEHLSSVESALWKEANDAMLDAWRMGINVGPDS